MSFEANFSFSSLAESPPRHLQITVYKINNGLLMRNAVQLCLAANNIPHMRKGNRAFLILAIALAWKMADHFVSLGYSLKKQTRWLNVITIIELGYRKISWFVSVSLINYLPQPLASANNWSACHRQIVIFCSTSSNNC